MAIKVAKDNGLKEELDEGKLWNSLYYPAKEAHIEEERAVKLADEVKHKIMDWMRNHEDNVFTSREIAERASGLLNDLNQHAALMYDKHLDIN